MTIGDLVQRFPYLPHPITIESLADLAEQLRKDLAMVEAVLAGLRQERIGYRQYGFENLGDDDRDRHGA